MSTENEKSESVPVKPKRIGEHVDARAALGSIGAEFSFWTSKLSDSSIQMCYALVGANWIVFGSVAGLVRSLWARASLFMVLLTLGVNLFLAWWASEMHRERYEYAESDSERWESEFKAPDKDWPATVCMVRVGYISRLVKLLLPLCAAVILLIGALRK